MTEVVAWRQRLPGYWIIVLTVNLLWLSACSAPQVVGSQAAAMQPRIGELEAQMDDGFRLPLRVWGDTASPATVVLGLHGFNDYSRAFAPLAEHLRDAGITTYAADQRGFGATALAGRWHGSDRLAADVRVLVELLRARHPDARLVVVGESMGAAVAVTAADASLPIDGLVLIAPAVWSRETMPWYQRAALAIAARTVPGMRLTGEGVPIHPSDNIEMLQAMGRDPLVVKATRVDALWGVTNLMDEAVRRGPPGHRPTLILYGEQDQIIPPPAFCRFAARLALDRDMRLVLYRKGWHMLPRDLQGERVRRDIAAWIEAPNDPLPSGEEITGDSERLTRFCKRAES